MGGVGIESFDITSVDFVGELLFTEYRDGLVDVFGEILAVCDYGFDKFTKDGACVRCYRVSMVDYGSGYVCKLLWTVAICIDLGLASSLGSKGWLMCLDFDI